MADGTDGVRVCDPQEYYSHKTIRIHHGHRPHHAFVNRKSGIVNFAIRVSGNSTCQFDLFSSYSLGFSGFLPVLS